MLDDSDAGGAVSSEPNAAAASGGEEAARALNVAVVRVASSKHVRDLRGALAKRGRRGLDAVIGAFARADGTTRPERGRQRRASGDWNSFGERGWWETVDVRISMPAW